MASCLLKASVHVNSIQDTVPRDLRTGRRKEFADKQIIFHCLCKLRIIFRIANHFGDLVQEWEALWGVQLPGNMAFVDVSSKCMYRVSRPHVVFFQFTSILILGLMIS